MPDAIAAAQSSNLPISRDGHCLAAGNGSCSSRAHRESHVDRILIVDDEQGQRRSLAIALRYEGFDVTEAASSEEAIEVLGSSARFDAALVDVVMPGMNGLELARQVHSRHPRIKIILISAYHLSRRQLVLSGTGAVAFLPKPYRMNRLVSFLRERVDDLEPTDPEILEA